MMYYFFYRNLMRIAHRFNWHYAPPVFPEGDKQLWCKWCGFRMTVQRQELPSANALLLGSLLSSPAAISPIQATESDAARKDEE